MGCDFWIKMQNTEEVIVLENYVEFKQKIGYYFFISSFMIQYSTLLIENQEIFFDS